MSFVEAVRRDGTTTGTVPDVNPSSIVAVSGTPTRSTHGSCVNMDACTFPVSSCTSSRGCSDHCGESFDYKLLYCDT